MAKAEIVQWDATKTYKMRQLQKYVSRLQANCQCNVEGKPLQLVNPKVILDTDFLVPLETLIDDPPKGAILQVGYLEGLPTVDGLPIWEKLEGEPILYYKLFKRYREMKGISSGRAVFKLAREQSYAAKDLELLRQSYHWNIRVQAYDLYMEHERSDMLKLRRQEVEGRHAKTAAKLFTTSAKYLTEHDDLLTPSIALKMMDLAVKLERISTGMCADRHPGQMNNMPTVNIQNNVQDGNKKMISMVSQDKDTNKDRLSQMLNVMNNIGLLKGDAQDEQTDVPDGQVSEH